MKSLRLFFAAALLGLAVTACTSPTVEYPQPTPDEEEPDPGEALVITQDQMPSGLFI